MVTCFDASRLDFGGQLGQKDIFRISVVVVKDHERHEVSSSRNYFVQTTATGLSEVVLEDGEAAAVLADYLDISAYTTAPNRS